MKTQVVNRMEMVKEGGMEEFGGNSGVSDLVI